jgi:DNA polymerase-1
MRHFARGLFGVADVSDGQNFFTVIHMASRLLLVDGSSYLYRAFHALPDLRNMAGEPTGAIYGMIGMLRRLKQDYPSDYAVCVFDAKGKTFRDDLFAEYKATRSPMPPDLVAQIEPIHQAVNALGWKIVMVEGIEADDVIGTLTVAARAQGVQSVVSTGDKDLAQLVNADVTLVNTMSNEVLDENGVQAKFNVSPAQMIDYLTLMGDTVDNVPGVEKCGPKTAAKWLAEYGSLDNLLQHASEIKGVVGENLRKAMPRLELSRTLVTVKIDCVWQDWFADFNEVKTQDEDPQALLEFFKRKGFKSWLREMETRMGSNNELEKNPQLADSAKSLVRAGEHNDDANQKSAHVAKMALAPEISTPVEFPPRPARSHYQAILSQAEFDDFLNQLQQASAQNQIVALDTETTSLDYMQAQLVGISFCWQAGTAFYLPLAHRDAMDANVDKQLPFTETLNALKPWLENPHTAKVGQHLKYDTHVFANHGVALKGIVHDTLLQSYVLEAHKNHSLDDLCQRHLGYKVALSFEDVCGKGAQQKTFDLVEIERATQYAAEDADLTLQVHQVLWPQIEKQVGLRHIYANIEMPTSLALQAVERNGVLIDVQKLQAQSHEIGGKLITLEAQAHLLAGQPFNLNSPKQLGEIFFEKLGLPVVKKTPTGAPSTDEEVLSKLAENYPLPKVILENRSLAKLKSTYSDKLPRMVNPRTGRVHTHYAQAVAVTGRLASNDPNLQNIPIRTAEGRRIREAFIAATGSHIVSADYSQIELRIMAHISGDENLLHAFANGLDIHRATAAEIFGIEVGAVESEQRRYAKVINFGLIYGMSAFGLAGNLGIERSAAQNYIDRYFTRYPAVARYMEETRQSAKQTGYVETVFGRRLWLPEIHAANAGRRQGAERAAINAPMQGTAADLIKLAMVAVQNWLVAQKLASKLIMQVHDELVLEVPEPELEIVRSQLPKLMAEVAQLKVPLLAEVGVGNNWDEAH